MYICMSMYDISFQYHCIMLATSTLAQRERNPHSPTAHPRYFLAVRISWFTKTRSRWHHAPCTEAWNTTAFPAVYRKHLHTHPRDKRTHTWYIMPQDTAREKRSKWGLFSHKGDKDHNNNGNHDAAITDGPALDSTYGGSQTPATSGNSLDDNHNNNGNHRNHTLNNDNGNSQTVTTTTTTTTTTTSGPGSNSSSSYNADPSQHGNNGYNYENTDRPSIPAKSNRRDHSPSAMGTNYSRPSNSFPTSPDTHPNALSSNPANSQYGPHLTTLQGLKTAAAGIHVRWYIYILLTYNPFHSPSS